MWKKDKVKKMPWEEEDKKANQKRKRRKRIGTKEDKERWRDEE